MSWKGPGLHWRVVIVTLVAGLCVAPNSAFAQEPVRLALPITLGQTVWATVEDGSEITGVVTRIAPDSLDISGMNGTTSVSHSGIRHLEKQDSLRNGFRNGAIFGAIAGIAYALEAAPPDTDRGKLVTGVFYYSALGAVVYGGIGALIDRAIDGRETIYQRSAGEVRLRVAPLLSRRVLGLSASVRW